MKKYSRIGSLAVAALALLLTGLMIGSGVQAAAGGTQPPPQQPADQAPYHITISGKISTLPVASSVVSVTFRLYDVSRGGNAFFVEQGQITPAADGTFTYQLGTQARLLNFGEFSAPVYLGITAGNGGEQPRQPLAGAAYAMSLIPGAGIRGGGPYLFSVIENEGYGHAIYSQGYIGLEGEGSFRDHSWGVAGLSASQYGVGAGGITNGAYGIGVLGDTCEPSHPCQPTAIGGYFRSYYGNSNAVGMQVIGLGQATGGFVTGGGYSLMVRYHGSTSLQVGDVLALDGNNETFDNAPIFGTTRADASNAGAAVGVAIHRYNVITAPAATSEAQPAMIPPGEQRTQVDEAATTFQSGDLIQVVVVGQAQMKVSGNVKLGDHLTIGSDGSIIVAAKDGSDNFGKVAGKPDANGTVSVFVNFK